MSFELESVRERRIVSSSLANNTPNSLCIFLGLFNSEKYISDLQSDLLKQNLSDCEILAVDNFSKDNTWELIQPWLEIFSGRITLVKNPLNLGSTGSQWLNQDLIRSPWLAFMHQDDRYKPSHFVTLVKEIEKSQQEIVSIFTCMGSISETGKKSASLPRQAILIPDDSQITAFLSSLRQHYVTWPSAAFKTSSFNKILPPWHSTAFPDTEIILRLSAFGKFKFINKETMMYREHSASESHSTGFSEAQIGISASLARVFASNEFVKIAQLVPIELREKFLTSIGGSIELRLDKSALGSMVRLIAEESLANAWNYENDLNLTEISSAYKSLNVERIENLIEDLLKFGSKTNANNFVSNYEYENLSQLTNNAIKNSNLFGGSTRKIYNYIGLVIPKKIRDLGFKFYIRLASHNSKNHPWNFEWK